MALTMERWQNTVAVVTGAGSGIGEAIAKLLVEDGLQVVGFDKREDRLKKLTEELKNKKGKFYYVKINVSKEEEVTAGFKWVTQNIGPLHILVNNAGVLLKNTMIEGDVAKWRQILDVNVLGLSICTKEAVNIMMKNKIDGHIIHISSLAGHRVPNFPGMNMNIYPASKFAVTALRDTLQHELDAARSRIKVTSISPGVVKTELSAAFAQSKELKEIYEKSLLPEDVAQAVRYVLSTPPRVQVKDLSIQPVGVDI